MTCEGSLYFQSPDSFHLCRKDLLRHYRTPALIHHGSKWAYHFPEHRQVTIRCPQEKGQSFRTVSLMGSGLIHNARRTSDPQDPVTFATYALQNAPR